VLCNNGRASKIVRNLERALKVVTGRLWVINKEIINKHWRFEGADLCYGSYVILTQHRINILYPCVVKLNA